MPRTKRDARYMNLYIATDAANSVDDFSKSTGIPKSRIVENAIREYMEKHIKDQGGKKHYVI